ncbi:hypothetical protein DXV75_10245 [Alteromonas aestuariivivens]|uniref:Tryptophan 7-halogenase n=1 Tax=Alteromonas aestuariivivens TaxID=1938339 RepID=A0A3D8M7Q5_9ALTE|nr:tryptophan 7-halogenase [Alteromonas aestuariivivens]RDV25653.1 hypothetical protein DXV75_10245 [Alteromonas aestuariivivens]
MNHRVIGVVGQGLMFQIASSWLSRTLSPFGAKIIGFETPVKDGPVVAEWGPGLHDFCAVTGLSLAGLMRECQGNFCWGLRCNWFKRGALLPYGSYGLKSRQKEFEHGMLRMFSRFPERNPDEFSLAGSAACLGRFALPMAQWSGWAHAMRSGVTLEAAQLASLLHTFNQQLGVVYLPVSDDSIPAEAHPQVDFWLHIASVAGGSKSAESIEETLLPESCCGYSELHSQAGKTLKLAHTRRQTLQYGLRQGAQHQSGQGRYFRQFKRFSASWTGNQLRLELPLLTSLTSPFDTLIDWLQKLLELWPAQFASHALAMSYRQYADTYIAEAEDFEQTLFGKQSLQRQLFLRCGRLLQRETGAVSDAQWFALLMGMGDLPQRSSVVLEATDDESLFPVMEEIARRIRCVVSGMPEHREFVSRFCNAGVPLNIHALGNASQGA